MVTMPPFPTCIPSLQFDQWLPLEGEMGERGSRLYSLSHGRKRDHAYKIKQYISPAGLSEKACFKPF